MEGRPQMPEGAQEGALGVDCQQDHCLLNFTLFKNLMTFRKKPNEESSDDPAIALPGICPKEPQART